MVVSRSSDHSSPVVVVIGEMGGGKPPGLDRVADVRYRFASTAKDLERALPGAEIALVWDFRSPLLSTSLHHGDSLRWVHVAGAGVDAVLSPALSEGDIVLTNAGNVFDRSIAETVAGWMLAFAKDMLRTFQLQQQRTWMHREAEMLAGQSALIVGMGSIGREIARVLRALRVDVTGIGTKERTDPEFGVIRSIDDLDGLLPKADFVVLVLPLTDRTRGLFGSEQLRLMKRTARFINVGRGELVDEDALVAALRSGDIAGAALDVFRQEPLPEDHPFWSMPRVLVSPHMSADFHGWLDTLSTQFLDNLERWLQGKPLTDVVDKQLGYIPGGHREGEEPS